MKFAIAVALSLASIVAAAPTTMHKRHPSAVTCESLDTLPTVFLSDTSNSASNGRRTLATEGKLGVERETNLIYELDYRRDSHAAPAEFVVQRCNATDPAYNLTPAGLADGDVPVRVVLKSDPSQCITAQDADSGNPSRLFLTDCHDVTIPDQFFGLKSDGVQLAFNPSTNGSGNYWSAFTGTGVSGAEPNYPTVQSRPCSTGDDACTDNSIKFVTEPAPLKA